MSYKTVLVHVDESRHASERIKLAATVAMAENAHLIGMATTGASRYIQRNRLLAELDPNFMVHLEFLRQRASRGLAEFDCVVQQLAIPSFEKQLVDDEAGGGVCLQARYCDLLVIGQNDPKELSPVVMPDFPQYVMLNSGRPVLIIPHEGKFETIGNRVMIAWDASMAASRAITGALPLLKRAQIVEVAIFDAHSLPQQSQQPTLQGAAPGSELARYLGRHNIQVEVMQGSTDRDIGAALLSLTNDRDCDLLVMGGYGHARFREIVLGGVTQTVLDTMSIPVLMSH